MSTSPAYYQQQQPNNATINNSNNQKIVFNDDDDDDDDIESRYESLKDAIAHRDNGSIVWLLNEGCPVNVARLDRAAESPLHVAVAMNDLRAARLLLSAGADVNSTNLLKQTALHMAFELRRRDMVDLLLSHCEPGCNPFTVYGLSHFHVSCVRNNWRLAHAYLERGVSANVHLEKCFYGKDYVFYRPLHLAVKYESFEVAELLLRYGANVNARDRYQRTPLHLACRYNCERIREALESGRLRSAEELLDAAERENEQLDIVKLLLRYGAELEALDANGTPPLFHVFKSDYEEIRGAIGRRLVLDEQAWARLLKSFKLAQKAKLCLLVEEGADVRFASRESRETLLHLVIDGRRLFTSCAGSSGPRERELRDEEKADIVDALLQFGADAEARNASGQTGLQLAIAGCLARTVRVLLEYCAAVEAVRFFHYKPPRKDATISCSREFAELLGFVEIVGMMLERKAEFGIDCGNELLVLRHLAEDAKLQHLENCAVGELRRVLDFSDVNRIDLTFFASESSMLFSREKLNMLLEHVLKLELAGFELSPRVRRRFLRCGLLNYSSRSCQAYVERCKDEIRRLKARMIDRYASFYDLMFLNANEIAVRMKNQEFRRAASSLVSQGEFTIYGNIVVKQFVKGLLRSLLFDTVKEYVLDIVDRDLPDPCSEAILGHLKNEDFCNLALAFAK